MSQTTSSTQLDIPGIAAALKGKIRGQAVAVTLFRDEIHPAYSSSERVDACAILRIARDENRPVHMNSENHDCSHGSFLTGFDDGNELIASGRLLQCSSRLIPITQVWPSTVASSDCPLDR